ncbi:MAG: hypothetical protein LBU22_14845 [Dysgonamonadaceae bacterium]|jgi:hypothetical protein|nr:hypothetical protein [Dysgonamonadaceae bacterium]
MDFYFPPHGYEADFTKIEYSINKGLWGTSIDGKETLKSEQTLANMAKLTRPGRRKMRKALRKLPLYR